LQSHTVNGTPVIFSKKEAASILLPANPEVPVSSVYPQKSLNPIIFYSFFARLHLRQAAAPGSKAPHFLDPKPHRIGKHPFSKFKLTAERAKMADFRCAKKDVLED